jgi:hypothetical protein
METKITNVEEFYNFMHMLADIGVITEEEHDSAINVVSGLVNEIEAIKVLHEYEVI